jgi:hypothetical protein
VIFVDFLLLLRGLLFVMLRLSLVEIAVELVPPRAALDVVLLVVIAIIQIPEVIITHICPKGILFFFFLAIDQIVHLGPPLLPKLHIPYCQIFRLDFRN